MSFGSLSPRRLGLLTLAAGLLLSSCRCEPKPREPEAASQLESPRASDEAELLADASTDTENDATEARAPSRCRFESVHVMTPEHRDRAPLPKFRGGGFAYSVIEGEDERVVVSAAGVHRGGDDGADFQMMADGLPIYAARVEGKERLVHGLTLGPPFDDIGTIVLDAEGRNFGYAAKSGARWQVVKSGILLATKHDAIQELRFTAAGDLAFIAQNGPQWQVFRDDRAFASERQAISQLAIDDTASHLSYVVADGKQAIAKLDDKVLVRCAQIRSYGFAAGDAEPWLATSFSGDWYLHHGAKETAGPFRTAPEPAFRLRGQRWQPVPELVVADGEVWRGGASIAKDSRIVDVALPDESGELRGASASDDRVAIALQDEERLRVLVHSASRGQVFASTEAHAALPRDVLLGAGWAVFGPGEHFAYVLGLQTVADGTPMANARALGWTVAGELVWIEASKPERLHLGDVVAAEADAFYAPSFSEAELRIALRHGSVLELGSCGLD